MVATAHTPNEASISTTKNVLLVFPGSDVQTQYPLADTFCGEVIVLDGPAAVDLSGKNVYLAGDLAKVEPHANKLVNARQVSVVDSLCSGSGDPAWKVIDLGQVPVLTHGMGVYYRRFFPPETGDYFTRISSEHTFQELTQAKKASKAHRTGIYLTPVTQDEHGVHFRLLRCSTNLTGPTDNFRATDNFIVDELNRAANEIFVGHTPLNHVLAQIYKNVPADGAQQQIKARIQAHSDKTKDMPESGIMAFCTFYDELEKLQPLEDDPFDWGINGVSALTKLHFKLKESVRKQPGCSLPHKFSVTLYPNSVFFMPLHSNRLYTHEIRPSMLDAKQLPTRLGYVVRCSSAEAVHVDGTTFLKSNGTRVKLAHPEERGEADLRTFYKDENQTGDVMDYGDKFLFSMNDGDYLEPGI